MVYTEISAFVRRRRVRMSLVHQDGTLIAPVD